MYAAERGHADCVRLLIEAGADKEANGNVRRRSSRFSFFSSSPPPVHYISVSLFTLFIIYLTVMMF
jgi:hypothetical protein